MVFFVRTGLSPVRHILFYVDTFHKKNTTRVRVTANKERWQSRQSTIPFYQRWDSRGREHVIPCPVDRSEKISIIYFHYHCLGRTHAMICLLACASQRREDHQRRAHTRTTIGSNEQHLAYFVVARPFFFIACHLCVADRSTCERGEIYRCARF